MKGNKKMNEAHVLGKTERDASGEWTLRTQTGAIVAVVGAVVILLSRDRPKICVNLHHGVE